MANWAALVSPLSISGSRLSDGTPNASGQVWLFQPGTATPVNGYSDAAATTIVTQPIVLTDGGLLNRSDLPGGLFVTQPVRLYIEDVNGTAVSDMTYIPATAGDVGISNEATTATTLDQWITQAQTSTGGTDFNYLIANGQTPRPIGATITELAVSVKAFGAKGDGIAIDTTSIQSAMNFVKAEGGGVVYFPPGTYLIDQAITLSSADGVTVLGAGIAATVVTSTHATANAFTFSSCDSLTIEGIRVSHSATSTGSAFSLTSCPNFYITRAGSYSGPTGVYRYGFYLDTCVIGTIVGAKVIGPAADASARAMVLTSSTNVRSVNSFFTAAGGYGLEAIGSAGNIGFFGCGGTTPRFANGLTGTIFDFYNCTFADYSVATATIPLIRTFGGAIQASATSSAVGAAQTPSLIAGDEVILTAASGGAGIVTVNAPAVLPPTTTDAANLYWNFVFKNASGGAVTWTLNAVFVVSAAIPTTDAHTIGVRFRWDRTTSKLREVSRADTVT